VIADAPHPLAGVNVLVAGAGLAGLAAARDLVGLGANVTVVDARARVGGRVSTLREGFKENQHAEAGGDMIDEAQEEIRGLCKEMGLKLTRILRGGFGYVRLDATGKPRIVTRDVSSGWERITKRLSDVIRPYRLAEQRWDTPIAADLARRSVAQWLDDVHADEELRATTTGLRGFFLADPEDLSLLEFVEQFGSDSNQAPWNMYRIEGGNDRLAVALATSLGNRVRLNTELVAVSHRGQGVRATLKHGGAASSLACDYLLLALPATTLRRVPIAPALPAQQHDAIARLRYGPATKTLIQFSQRFWRAPGRPRAFGSALPFGSLWEGNEEQRGRAGIVSLLAGGGASAASQEILSRDGAPGFQNALEWLGSKRAEILNLHQIVWEHDPLARGGYAYFDPEFPPSLRAWLARPCGRLFFAGEHTSIKWQGYMNGAVESGRRAAAEIVAVHREMAGGTTGSG
jgi:monoamine oxidase